jgi:hypothetical protein
LRHEKKFANDESTPSAPISTIALVAIDNRNRSGRNIARPVFSKHVLLRREKFPTD